jgi:hypothetical protein
VDAIHGATIIKMPNFVKRNPQDHATLERWRPAIRQHIFEAMKENRRSGPTRFARALSRGTLLLEQPAKRSSPEKTTPSSVEPRSIIPESKGPAQCVSCALKRNYCAFDLHLSRRL